MLHTVSFAGRQWGTISLPTEQWSIRAARNSELGLPLRAAKQAWGLRASSLSTGLDNFHDRRSSHLVLDGPIENKKPSPLSSFA